jgi:hypothetical protein
MSPFRVNQYLVATALASCTGHSRALPRFSVTFKPFPYTPPNLRRWASTAILDSEPASITHHSTALNPDYSQHGQRREVSTADLDKTRDHRERVVILGSGIYFLSSSHFTKANNNIQAGQDTHSVGGSTIESIKL